MCENHDYCYVEMPEENNKILKYNQREKSMKVPFIIYADLECFLEKMNTCHDQQSNYINTHHLVINCLHTVHLIQQKIILIIIEVKIA